MLYVTYYLTHKNLISFYGDSFGKNCLFAESFFTRRFVFTSFDCFNKSNYV